MTRRYAANCAAGAINVRRSKRDVVETWRIGDAPRLRCRPAEGRARAAPLLIGSEGASGIGGKPAVVGALDERRLDCARLRVGRMRLLHADRGRERGAARESALLPSSDALAVPADAERRRVNRPRPACATATGRVGEAKSRSAVEPPLVGPAAAYDQPPGAPLAVGGRTLCSISQSRAAAGEVSSSRVTAGLGAIVSSCGGRGLGVRAVSLAR